MGNQNTSYLDKKIREIQTIEKDGYCEYRGHHYYYTRVKITFYDEMVCVFDRLNELDYKKCDKKDCKLCYMPQPELRKKKYSFP